MTRFSNLLICECNVYLALYCGTLEFFKQGVPKNYVLLTEEVLFENMTLDEKKKKLDYYIKNGVKDKKLLIIDGYLFAKGSKKEYIDLLSYLLKESNFSKLNIITKKSNYDEQVYNSVVDGLGKEIQIYFSNNYHDRFWIADCKKGFSTGSSLNGIGGKVCRISFLDNDEVKDIINDVKDIIEDK